jgi:hypothetical protein
MTFSPDWSLQPGLKYTPACSAPPRPCGEPLVPGEVYIRIFEYDLSLENQNARNVTSYVSFALR